MGLLFTYGLTYGGAFVSLFNPFIGLLIYICFAILRPEQLWFFSVPQGNYSRIVAVALLIGWLFRGFGSWKFGRATPVVMSLIALMAWTTLSAGMIAGNQTPAWTYVEILAKIVLPFLVGITLIDSLSQLKQLAWVILLSEGFLAFEFNLWFFAGDNRLRDEGFGGMDNNCNAIALVTCLGLAGFLFFGCRLWWQKAIALGAAGFMAHAVMFTFSRGGMLAMIITAGVAFYLIPKRPAHILWLIAALLVMWRWQAMRSWSAFSRPLKEKDVDQSAEHRLELWRGCIQTMQDHPLGVGPANWGDVVVRFGFPRGKHAHTLWLQSGSRAGSAGAVPAGHVLRPLHLANLAHVTRELHCPRSLVPRPGPHGDRRPDRLRRGGAVCQPRTSRASVLHHADRRRPPQVVQCRPAAGRLPERTHASSRKKSAMTFSQ